MVQRESNPLPPGRSARRSPLLSKAAAAAVAAALTTLTAAAFAADVTTISPTTGPSVATAAAPAPATAPSTAPASPLEALRAAANPSAAVDAYARAATTQPGNIDLEKAYIRKMVDLNVPEMADLQARNLVQRDGSDGLAWAVVAYMAAARGAPAAAIMNLKTAIQQSPDDPFVLRTAAQVVAWYDAQTDRSMLSKDDTQTLEWIRAQGAGRPAYADAYRAAADLRRNWAANNGAPATQPAASAPATQPYAADSVAAGTQPQQPPPVEYSYPTYSDPYAWYPIYPAYPYGGGGYYWSSPGIIILRGHDFDGHHHHFGNGGYWHDGHFHDGGLVGVGPRMPGPTPRVTPGGSFNNTDHTFARPGWNRPGGGGTFIQRGATADGAPLAPHTAPAPPPVMGNGDGARGTSGSTGARGTGGGDGGSFHPSGGDGGSHSSGGGGGGSGGGGHFGGGRR